MSLFIDREVNKEMPVYEYECQECEDIIEIWQSLSDDPMNTCPSCRGSLKKIISMSSFQLKGGGWFADGYSSTDSSSSTSSASTTSCSKSNGKTCSSC